MRAALLALLLASPVVAADPSADYWTETRKQGNWFASGSYFQVEDLGVEIPRECHPALRYDLKDRYGFNLGLGYEFPSGWSMEGGWLRLREDGQHSDGFMVTGRVPLRFLRPCCQ